MTENEMDVVCTEHTTSTLITESPNHYVSHRPNGAACIHASSVEPPGADSVASLNKLRPAKERRKQQSLRLTI